MTLVNLIWRKLNINIKLRGNCVLKKKTLKKQNCKFRKKEISFRILSELFLQGDKVLTQRRLCQQLTVRILTVRTLSG